MLTKHVSLSKDECTKLRYALRRNALDGDNLAIITDPVDTSFVGVFDLNEQEMEQELICAIKNIPNHY